MQVEIVRHALDRVPLSLIIDDATVLVNLNYFFMRDRNLVDGQNRRWEDVPVVHPEWFTRQFAEWCAEQGVRGKFSIVPCPAALGRIDQGLPLFSRAQQEQWLHMCREYITPVFDINPEMMTHTVVVDPKTYRPLASGIWEQYDWEALPVRQEALVRDYIAAACRILANVGLVPEGVTSPGGFGGRTMAFYARVAGEALHEVTGHRTPYFFKRAVGGGRVDTHVWEQNRDAGYAVGEVVASTHDRTGSWTGYGEVDPDYYLTRDLCSGRLADVIDAGGPAIMCSHWQGFYGLHSEDQGGFRALKTVVSRLRERDPRGEHTRWRKCSEIATYACARAMGSVTVSNHSVDLDLPVQAPEMTLRLSGPGLADRVCGIAVDGVPLRRVDHKAAFESGTFLVSEGSLLLAFDARARHSRVVVNA